MKTKIIIVCFSILMSSTLFAQQDRNKNILHSLSKGLEYSVRAGISLGGVAPLPLPAEIRKIESYNPTVCIAVEGDVHKRFDKKWGLMFGVRLETKGMETDAKVKSYHMSMMYDGEPMEGNFTGNVKTIVRNTYLTFPVLGTYRVSPRWDLKLGPYFSYVTNREFSGVAYNGYLRDETPIGQKVEVPAENPAPYDFSKDLRKFQWGVQLGTEWKAFSHLNVYADLTWGLNSAFQKDFDTITFEMYPIYATLGFAYVF